MPPKRSIEPDEPRRLLVALAAPEHEADLVQTGRYIAAGREEGGEVLGLHLVEVPLHTPLEMAGEQPREPHFIEATITAELEARQASEPASPLGRTSVEVFTDFTHDVPDALVNETSARGADMLFMGWEGEFSLRRVLEHPVQRVMSRIRADLGVLKARGLVGLESALVPWGGGIHARLGLEVALRIGRSAGARVELLRVVRPEVDVEEEEAELLETVDDIAGAEGGRVSVHIRRHDSVIDGIGEQLDDGRHDLVVIGASRDSRIRQVLFGSIPDKVAARADCSVLMVRRYLPDHWTVRTSEAMKRLRERAGMTTSPEG